VDRDADYATKIGLCGTLTAKKKRKQLYESRASTQFDRWEPLPYGTLRTKKDDDVPLKCCRTVTIYCRSGSDFGTASVPDVKPDPGHIQQLKKINKICIFNVRSIIVSQKVVISCFILQPCSLFGNHNF
jgi:hypothetical protein